MVLPSTRRIDSSTVAKYPRILVTDGVLPGQLVSMFGDSGQLPALGRSVLWLPHGPGGALTSHGCTRDGFGGRRSVLRAGVQICPYDGGTGSAVAGGPPCGMSRSGGAADEGGSKSLGRFRKGRPLQRTEGLPGGTDCPWQRKGYVVRGDELEEVAVIDVGQPPTGLWTFSWCDLSNHERVGEDLRDLVLPPQPRRTRGEPLVVDRIHQKMPGCSHRRHG